jgi:transposase-like protein
MLYRCPGGRVARSAKFAESTGCCCCSRRWARNRSDSPAPIVDASAESLIPFVQDSVAPGSVIHTDGWLGYLPLERKGYTHQVTFLRIKKKTPSELMPRVHQVISLLKRWLLGTHQGAVSHKYLDYYLDEFTFRFNRRRSKSRGKLFFRLAQQTVAVDPVTLYRIVHPNPGKPKTQSVGAT